MNPQPVEILEVQRQNSIEGVNRNECSQPSIMGSLTAYTVSRYQAKPLIEQLPSVRQKRKLGAKSRDGILCSCRIPPEPVAVRRACRDDPELHKHLRCRTGLIASPDQSLHGYPTLVVSNVIPVDKTKYDIRIEEISRHQ